jgi:hypothetical protein
MVILLVLMMGVLKQNRALATLQGVPAGVCFDIQKLMFWFLP